MGKTHLWLGLMSGLVVFILGITGCIYVFEEEIKSLVYTNKLTVTSPHNVSPKLLSENFKSAQRALGPDKPITYIHLPNEKSKSQLFWARGSYEEPIDNWSYSGSMYDFIAYVNPYTSNVLKVENRFLEFFEVNRKLHTSLLLRPDIGHKVVGTATLIFVIMLITGLILWWPRNRGARKQRVWFRWKSITKWKRKNYDLHNILGFYSMFLAIFIALTGLVWSFKWFENSVRWVANGGQTIERERVRTVSDPGLVSSSHPLDMIYSTITTNYSEAEKYYIIPPKDSLGVFISSVIFKDRTRIVTLLFDQYNGKQLLSYRWNDYTNGDKLRALNYDIHVGAIGGIVGKTIAFFVSLFSASLPVTGFMIWYGRRKKKKNKCSARTSNCVATKKSAQAKPMPVHPKVKIPSSID